MFYLFINTQFYFQVKSSKIVKKKFILKHNPQFAETVELSIKCGPKRFQNYSGFIR